MRVLVTGANGRTGFLCVQTLVERGMGAVGLVRSPDHTKRIENTGATALVGDLLGSPDALLDRAGDIDAVIFAASNTYPADPERLDHEATVAFAAACEKRSILRFILVSSLGTTFPERMPPFLIPYLVAKRQAEVFLEQSRLHYTILRPGGLTDSPGTGLVTLKGEQAPGRQVARADVAAVAVSCLTQGGTVHKAFDILQGATPIQQALGAL